MQQLQKNICVTLAWSHDTAALPYLVYTSSDVVRHCLHSDFLGRLLIHMSLLVHEQLIHVLSLAATVRICIDGSCLISGSGKLLVSGMLRG